MTKAKVFYAPAKINLFLNITRRGHDGYHSLNSIMLPVGLFDRLSISITENHAQEFNFHSSHKELEKLPLSDNVLYQAARKFYNALERPFPQISCSLEKNIPVGAGLGGGSSDAAALLLYCNRFYGHPFSREELCKIAQKAGMDIPFFITSSPAVIQGKGEEVHPFLLEKVFYCLIIWPEIHISTAKAYQWLDEVKLSSLHLLNKTAGIIKNKEWEKLHSIVSNDFEKVLFPRYPVMKSIKEELLSHKVLGAAVSGSGSALFALFDDPEPAHEAYDALKKKHDHIYLVKTLQDNSWRA